jgi:hypothetical protein
MGKVDVYDRAESVMADGHITILRINDKYDPRFIACFLRSPFGQLQFERWFTGSSGQIEIPPTDIGEFIVPKSDEGGILLKDQRELADDVLGHLEKSLDLKKDAKYMRTLARDLLVQKLGIECRFTNYFFKSGSEKRVVTPLCVVLIRNH